MTSKKYVVFTFAITFAFITLFSFLNIFFNYFGLFGSKDSIRIWGLEKTSKYLLSYKYISENFEGIIIGPSSSTNLNTLDISGFKIYNLSMGGANISELKYAADNVIKKGKIKYLIICLNPYITKNSGKKGAQIDEKEYWGSIFSILPIKIIKSKIKVLLIPEGDAFHSSEWGYNDFHIHKKDIIFHDIVEERKLNPRSDIIIDKTAYKELKSVIDLAHKKNVKILAYYYPFYHVFYNHYVISGSWENYKKEIDKLFVKNDIVWDMNSREYHYITQKYESYSDGHLNRKGARLVLKVIEKKLLEIDK